MRIIPFPPCAMDTTGALLSAGALWLFPHAVVMTAAIKDNANMIFFITMLLPYLSNPLASSYNNRKSMSNDYILFKNIRITHALTNAAKKNTNKKAPVSEC